MNNDITILVIGTIFEIVILIGAIILIFQFRGWAYKRDEYYNNKLLEYEQRLHDIEIKYLKDMAAMLTDNKALLNKYLKQKK